jgi:hypothetical protein
MKKTQYKKIQTSIKNNLWNKSRLGFFFWNLFHKKERQILFQALCHETIEQLSATRGEASWETADILVQSHNKAFPRTQIFFKIK